MIQRKSEKGTAAERVYVWGHAAAGALGGCKLNIWYWIIFKVEI